MFRTCLTSSQLLILITNRFFSSFSVTFYVSIFTYHFTFIAIFKTIYYVICYAYVIYIYISRVIWGINNSTSNCLPLCGLLTSIIIIGATVAEW